MAAAEHRYLIVHNGYLIVHNEGDWAEADTLAAAHVAARTLIDDNSGGTCAITDRAADLRCAVCGRVHDRALRCEDAR